MAGTSIETITWAVNVTVLATAAVIDWRVRRIPNWLSLPLLASGLSLRAVGGSADLWMAFAGSALALLLFGLPWYFGFVGLGDVKLAMGVGAWIGPGRFAMAFLIAGMAAGLMAVGYVVRDYRRRKAYERARHASPPGGVNGEGQKHGPLQWPDTLAMPYAPALAVGTVLSLFAR